MAPSADQVRGAARFRAQELTEDHGGSSCCQRRGPHGISPIECNEGTDQQSLSDGHPVTLRQLEIFLAVARAGSFRRAAERLALSQPALSQQVKELERRLDSPLFDRLGRSIGLTQAGRLLEEHARRIFAMLQGVQDAMRELRGLDRGSLLLGGSTTPGIYLLPWLLGRFKARHGGIEVSLRIGNTREIEERVRATEVDLGIIGGHLAAFKETCVEASLVDRIVLIVPPRHRWAGRRTIAPAGLSEECLLVREEGSATRRVTEAALQGVLAGLGVAFVSEYAVRSELAGGRLRSLAVRGVPIQRHFHVIRHEARSLTPAARAFLEFLRQDRGLRT
ncbi:MAG: LysR family transcriptional regulator [Candidatus Rokuibacteriota bacterium]|nr:MAG: LysR family transcriptional regulator [Candidatus Rokubacteria bacterium]